MTFEIRATNKKSVICFTLSCMCGEDLLGQVEQDESVMLTHRPCGRIFAIRCGDSLSAEYRGLMHGRTECAHCGYIVKAKALPKECPSCGRRQ